MLEFRIFPPPQLPVFRPGDRVFVKLRSQKETGHALIVGPAPAASVTPDNEAETSRWLVQYDTAGQASVNPTRIVPVYSKSPSVLICRSTLSYRIAARAQVGATDSVVEIGSSYGVCTEILSQHAKSVFGIEVSPLLVEEARRRQPMLRFELLNVLENPQRAIGLMNGVNKVFIDIGGNRTLTDVLRILALLKEGLDPALICVKSEEFADLAEKNCNEDGLIPDGYEWFSRLLQLSSTPAKKAEPWFVDARDKGFPKNPLRYGVRVTADGIPICRLHNYKPDGCPKPGLCTYDHQFCHHCGMEGHQARHCTL
ncbi:hypothetical protein HDU86_005688 [Geranomyces michiganensis]|nr:hypothetical protein HDU86_005688 [Geranomyces michiganensis]